MENKKVTVEIQLQMSWKKTVSFKSWFSTVLLLKMNTAASKKMYAFLTDRRREKNAWLCSYFLTSPDLWMADEIDR